MILQNVLLFHGSLLFFTPFLISLALQFPVSLCFFHSLFLFPLLSILPLLFCYQTSHCWLPYFVFSFVQPHFALSTLCSSVGSLLSLSLLLCSLLQIYLRLAMKCFPHQILAAFCFQESLFKEMSQTSLTLAVKPFPTNHTHTHTIPLGSLLPLVDWTFTKEGRSSSKNDQVNPLLTFLIVIQSSWLCLEWIGMIVQIDRQTKEHRSDWCYLKTFSPKLP